jgi:hypothetical protein
MNDDDLLIGWKAVARYFNRGEKTMRRWHRKYDLPIVKLGRSIYCSKIGLAFMFDRLAAYQRAHRASVAAMAKGAPAEVMNDFARAQAGAAIRARLADRMANGAGEQAHG